ESVWGANMAVFGAVEHTGRAHIQAASEGAVLAHVGAHQPVELWSIGVRWIVDLFLDSNTRRTKLRHPNVLRIGFLFGLRRAEGWHAEADETCSRFASFFDLVLVLFHEGYVRSEEHTSELQSRFDLVCRLL